MKMFFYFCNYNDTQHSPLTNDFVKLMLLFLQSIHTYNHTYILTCIHTHMHAYIHTYIHAYIHM